MDSLGNLYVGGRSDYSILPITPDAFQDRLLSQRDGFILKLDPTFSSASYCSYYDGSDNESIRAFGVNDDGTICVSGQSYSDDLYITDNAFQQNLGSQNTSDSFLAILKPYTEDDD